jgi:4-hydroxy-tetrahydrodipicolinate synthase
MATPYRADRSLDLEDLAREIDFLARCGVTGAVWPQISSEYQHLRREERIEGMRTLARKRSARGPKIILGVQGRDTDEALAYARLAEELQVDGMISMPPGDVTSAADLEKYFGALAAVTKRPFIMQTSGGPPGVEPTIDLIVSTARKYPNFCYLKEEYPPVQARMRELLKHCPPLKGVFGGSGGQHFLHEMRFGSHGTVVGAPYADIYVSLWRHFQQKRETEARELFSKLMLMVTVEQQIPLTRPYIMMKRGVFKTALSRQHRMDLTAAAIEEIEFNFEPLRRHLKA